MKLIYPKEFKMRYEILEIDTEYQFGIGTGSIYYSSSKKDLDFAIEVNPHMSPELGKIFTEK